MRSGCVGFGKMLSWFYGSGQTDPQSAAADIGRDVSVAVDFVDDDQNLAGPFGGGLNNCGKRVDPAVIVGQPQDRAVIGQADYRAFLDGNRYSVGLLSSCAGQDRFLPVLPFVKFTHACSPAFLRFYTVRSKR